MASHDPEFYQAPKFSPEYDEVRPRQRGCFFYGCVIASILAVLLIIALAIVSYVVYRAISQAIEQYTSTAPVELPKVQLTPEQREAVKQRVETFRKQVEQGTATEPLVLDSDDLNALIEENPDFKGRVFVHVEGEKLKAKVSWPLDVFDIGMLRGRYLNGEADLKASLSDGVLLVTLDSFEVNGRRPPDQFLDELRQQNLAKDAYKNPKNAELIRRFERLEIKDGKIILTPRRGRKEGPSPGKSAAAEGEDESEPSVPAKKGATPEKPATPTEEKNEAAPVKASPAEAAPGKDAGVGTPS
jgi:hypothetical protein